MLQLRNDESLRSELERLQLAIEYASVSLDKKLVFVLVLKLLPFHFFWFIVYRRLKGKELEGMGFSDLISLENQLNDSLHSVKDRKVKKTKIILFSKD